MNNVILRRAKDSDGPQLRAAVVELQEHERRLHATRLPGEQIADDYLKTIWQLADEAGAMFVAEVDGAFVGFAAGWVEQEDNIAETPDSNRFGYISDVCVLPDYRGRRIALRLITALEKHLRTLGVMRIRINTLAANASARASYERAGFVSCEVAYEKVVAGQDV